MTKITLNNVGNLIDAVTAANTINTNSATLVTAFDNTLSRDGTSPNTMGANLDMNNNSIINLPAPVSSSSPLRLAELSSFNGGGTISSLPAGGTTGQVLAKTSGTDYAVSWTGSPTLTAPVLGTATATTVNKVTITQPAASAVLTIPTGVTLTGPATSGTVATLGNAETITGVKTFGVAGNVGKLILAGNSSGTTVLNATAVATGTLTLPATTDTLVGKATTDTLTNKTLTSPTITAPTVSTGTFTSPTLVTPTLGAATATSVAFSPTTGGIIGTTTNDAAGAGKVGEYISANLLVGSAVSLSTGTASNVTSISLTAGDWDVWGSLVFSQGGTTVTTSLFGTINTTSATFPTQPNNGAYFNLNLPSQTGGSWTIPVGTIRLSLASTTTVFLIAQAIFTTSTSGAYGFIGARRVR